MVTSHPVFWCRSDRNKFHCSSSVYNVCCLHAQYSWPSVADNQSQSTNDRLGLKQRQDAGQAALGVSACTVTLEVPGVCLFRKSLLLLSFPKVSRSVETGPQIGMYLSLWPGSGMPPVCLFIFPALVPF